MFGNKVPFGNTTSFANSSFGTGSPFGQSTSTFGANKSLGAGFGAPFGSTTPNNTIFSTSGTSGGSIFGGTASSFGQPGTSSTGFGFTPTSSTGTGLFGSTAPQQTGSSLFQSPNSSAFGAPKSTFGGFGNTTSTGLFGQNQQPTTLFGQNSTTGTGLFGSSGNSFTSAFGSTASVPNGTTVKFNPVTGTDTMLKNGATQNISIRHQCITVMKEYESKSLEELRVEDYLANRKGPQQPSIAGFGGTNTSTMFGTNTPVSSTGLFQNQSKSLFGSTFGNNPSTSTVFGQANQPTTGLFGQKSMGFGTPSTTSSSFNFGTNGTTLFGSSANTQNKSLFGTTTNPTSTPALFGTTNTLQPNTAFGSTAFNTSFGAPTATAGGLFGSKTAFGAPATSASSFAFGSSTNSNIGSSLFSTKANTGFGATTPFGSTANNFGSVFGSNPNTGTSLFNQNKPATSFGSSGTTGFGTNLTSFGTSGGPLFGGTANKSGSLSIGLGAFGQNTGSTLGAPLNLPINTTVLGSDPNAAQLNQQATQTQQQLLALAQSPFGDSPLFRSVLQDTGRREEILKPTNPAAQKIVTANAKYKISPHPTAKVKPKSIRSLGNGQISLFDGLDEDDTLDSTTAFIPRRSIKKLELRPRSSHEGGALPLRGIPLENTLSDNSALASPNIVTSTGGVSPLTTPIRNQVSSTSDDDALENYPQSESPQITEAIIGLNCPPSKHIPGNNLRKTAELNNTIAQLNVKKNKSADENDDSEKENISQDLSTDGSVEYDSENELSEPHQPHPANITLRRSGYYTIPPLDKLGEFVDENGDCFVENFTIGRQGYGSVFFFGITNVTGMNLDEIVHFRKKQVTVYPDDENKPALGKGLNKKAEITLDGIWPTDKNNCKPIKSPDRLKTMGYQEKLERIAMKLGGKFLDYRPETGSWVFEVKHFSKYGLEDSDDEDDIQQGSAQELKKLKVLPPQPLQQMQLNVGLQPGMSVTDNGLENFQNNIMDHSHLNGLRHDVPHPSYRSIPDEDDEMEDVTQVRQHVFPLDFDNGDFV